MMAIALIAAILISYYRVKKAKLDVDVFSSLAIIAIAAGLLGGYLLYIFVTYSFSEIIGCIGDGSFRVFKQGGLVFYGSIIAGVLAALIYLKIKKQKFFDYAAAIIPAIPLAHAIGRVGCFLAGCCYGKVCDTPISVIYTNPVGGAPTGVPVFPIQLVESACNLVVFAILLIYTGKEIKKGSVIFLYMILYAVERFVLEYFRADEIRGAFLGISTSQWISIALFIGGIIGFTLLYLNEKKKRAAAGQQTDGGAPSGEAVPDSAETPKVEEKPEE